MENRISINLPSKSCPAVSVIIPLYNAEKYVGECLDSLLSQTFRDFEVIVVDDCSTDASVEIVQSYESRFAGRLRLTRTEKNSGNAGYTARNLGFSYAKGEYVYFVDADDFITKDALEILYTAAKNYDADVVYTGSRYLFTSDKGIELNMDGTNITLQEKGIVNKPVLTISEPHKNWEYLNRWGAFTAPWTKFALRNFLCKNGTTFPEIKSAGDVIWTMELFVSAERFLMIPNAIYFWRQDSVESVTHKKRQIDRQILLWISAFVSGAKYLSDLLKHSVFFLQNSSHCHMAWQYFFQACFRHTLWARLQVTSDKIYELLYRECRDDSDFDLIKPFFFSLIDSYQKNLLITQKQLRESTEQYQKLQTRVAELEKLERVNKAYISELENFIMESQQRIADLENELKRKS